MRRISRGLAVWITISSLLVPPLWAKKRQTQPITLTFVPQESTGTDYPRIRNSVIGTRVRILFEDARPVAAPTLVGQGQRDDDTTYEVHSVASAADFAGALFLEHARSWGLKISNDAEVTLRVSLLRFFVRESDKAVGSMYIGEVRVSATVERNGVRLWGGTAYGDARRYGKSDSHQNRNEVLSDAMVEAYANLLGDRGMQAAFASNAALPGEELTPIGQPRDNTPTTLLAEVLLLASDESVSDQLLITFIRQHDPVVPFTAQDVLEWKKAGLSAEVISAAMNRSSNH